MHFYPCIVLGLLLFFMSSLNAGPKYDHDPNVIEELRVRDGLPNVFKKLKQGAPVTVLYLGGSITHAEGWRPKTFAWLESKFPDAKLTQVDAAVPGTGADFGACRFEDDVRPHHPDLVFIEYRVNVGGGVEARAIEGLVRQIWEADPDTDICFVYTIGKWMVNAMEDGGKQYFFGKIMEQTANVYGIPTIDFAPELLRQKAAGELIFQGKEQVDGKLLFSKDGVHPIDAGHELYKDVVARSFEAMMGDGVSKPHVLPSPMEPQHLLDATLISISAAQTSGNWKSVDTENDLVYTENSFRTGKMLSNALKCSEEGATLTIHWEGTRLGITHIPQGMDMEVYAVTDGGLPVMIESKQQSPRYFAKFANLAELSQGKHTTTLTVTKLPDGTAFYVGQCTLLRDPKDHR